MLERAVHHPFLSTNQMGDRIDASALLSVKANLSAKTLSFCRDKSLIALFQGIFFGEGDGWGDRFPSFAAHRLFSPTARPKGLFTPRSPWFA